MHQVHTNIHIRTAGYADCEPICDLLHAAFEEFRDQYTEEAFRVTVQTPDGIRKRLSEGPVWVAIEDGTVVGTCSGLPRPFNTLYLRGMAVHPSHRGKRIGRRLLDEIEQYALENGYEAMMLSSTPYLKSAIHVYEQSGFTIVNDPPYELYATPLFSMRKSLN